MAIKSPIFKIKFNPIEYGFGLRQRVLVGWFKINSACVIQISELYKAFRSFNGDPKSRLYINRNEANQSLVSQFCEIYIRLHIEARIPLFFEYKLLQDIENREKDTFLYKICLPFWDLQASKIIFHWIHSALINGDRDIANAINSIKKFGIPDTNSMPLIFSIWKKSHFYQQISNDTFQLGIGAQSSYFSSSLLDSTSAPMSNLVSHKFKFNRFLSSHGVPVPKQLLVSSIDEAIKATKTINFPIVVKPISQEQGRGVSAGILNLSALDAAFDQARKYGKIILIEEYCVGQEYRITMLHDTIIKVVKRSPPSIVGDGVSSIEQLIIDKYNKTINNRDHRATYNPFNLEGATLSALKNQGLSPSDIPPLNQKILIRLVANISRGGSQVHVDLSSVHSDNILLFKRIASISRLGICGIDIICQDISLSWIHHPSHVIEINHRPQIGVRFKPEVYDDIVDGIVSGVKVRTSLVAFPPGLFSEVASVVDSVRSLLPDIVDWESTKHFTVTNNQLWQGSHLIFSSRGDDCFMSNSRLALLDQSAHSIIFISDYSVFLNYGLPVGSLDDAHIIRSDKDQNPLNIIHSLRSILCEAVNLSEFVLDD